ncbi:MAG: DUF501 domain-containing protein [Actinomycetota bacterium]|nr:DUF501 domain-containing protein [Actinomycetota bacterium]
MASEDLRLIAQQLGRSARGFEGVAHRCACGAPDVVRTSPRLPDGTPFPTTFYLTCPRLASAIGTLESQGLMREMEMRLHNDPALAAAYQRAHEHYLANRSELGEVAEIAGISAGGMPDRVKCLHVLAAHSLAAGPGINPLGDEVLATLDAWWLTSPCASRAVAAIDCGTNSIRLLIAEVPERGALIEIVREMRIVRLGEGVDRTGEFAPEALARTFAACDEYRQLIDLHGVRAIRFVATSASRDVSNRAAFIDGVRDRLGIEPEVIAGTEEAELSFLGAVRGLPALESPVLVVDIGGGSTEFVLGDFDADVDIHAAVSVNIGCVRMFERHLHADPASATQIADVSADVTAAFDEAERTVSLAQARSVVGVAGTVTTVSAMQLGLAEYDPLAIHGSVLRSDEIQTITDQLLAMNGQERAELPFMHPGRVDVIGAGALILSELARRVSPIPVIVSEYDILDGIVYRLASVSS